MKHSAAFFNEKKPISEYVSLWDLTRALDRFIQLSLEIEQLSGLIRMGKLQYMLLLDAAVKEKSGIFEKYCNDFPMKDIQMELENYRMARSLIVKQ